MALASASITLAAPAATVTPKITIMAGENGFEVCVNFRPMGGSIVRVLEATFTAQNIIDIEAVYSTMLTAGKTAAEA